MGLMKPETKFGERWRGRTESGTFGFGETEKPMGGLEPPSGDEPRIRYATSVDLQF